MSKSSSMRNLFLFCLLMLALSAGAQTIPAERLVNWADAGYPGEIPSPSLILDVTDFGVVPDDTLSAHAATWAAIDSLGGRQGVIYFPAGTYFFDGNFDLPDSVIIRGAGSELTHFQFNLGGTGSDCFTITRTEFSPFVDVTGGFHKGSFWITVADATVFTEGEYGEMEQDNGPWDTNPASYAVDVVGQMLKISSISGDTLFMETALRTDFDTTLNLRVRAANLQKEIGLECFSIERLDNASGIDAGNNFLFRYAASCWVRGVESKKSIGAHILNLGCMNITIRGNYFHDAFEYTGSSTRGYGVTCATHSNEVLVEDNIFRHLRHAMMVKEGCNGNVFAYNYSIEPNRSEPIPEYSGDISLHGHYAYANLFEGNHVRNIITDHYWGISGPNNAIFRNRASLYGILMTNLDNSPIDTDSMIYVGNEVTNTDFFFYGQYTLIGADHFQYGNNIKGTITPGGTSSLLDSSYYLPGKPDFWGISDPWPSIGYPNAIEEFTIPAEVRYLNDTVPLTYCGELIVYPVDTVPTDTIVDTIPEALFGPRANELAASVGPNPSNGAIFIHLESETNASFTGQLIALDGKVMVRETWRLAPGKHSLTLETDFTLAPGIYILRLESEAKSFTRKIAFE